MFYLVFLDEYTVGILSLSMHVLTGWVIEQWGVTGSCIYILCFSGWLGPFRLSLVVRKVGNSRGETNVACCSLSLSLLFSE